jgi:hypothetical protein
MEKHEMLAPGRLGPLVAEGLRGHHPLFDPAALREALAGPDEPVAREDADEVGRALLSICRDPPDEARLALAALSPRAHAALIRLYFRIVERAQERIPVRH